MAALVRGLGPEELAWVHVEPFHVQVSLSACPSPLNPPNNTTVPFSVAIAALPRALGPVLLARVQLVPLKLHVSACGLKHEPSKASQPPNSSSDRPSQLPAAHVSAVVHAAQALPALPHAADVVPPRHCPAEQHPVHDVAWHSHAPLAQ